MKLKKIVLVGLLLVCQNSIATELVKQVKVFDGTSVDCKKENSRFRSRFGSYRTKVNSLQIITKQNGQEYLQALGKFEFFRCQEQKGKGYLAPTNLDQPYQFKNLQLDNTWKTITVIGSKPTLMVLQDGIYKIIATYELSTASTSNFRIDIPLSDLNIDTSESASPLADYAFDMHLKTNFQFSSNATKSSQTIHYGSFRIHFNVERIMRGGLVRDQWQINLK